MNGKNINLFSREEYFDKVFRKSGSYNSLNSAKSSVKWLDRFCSEKYEKNTDETLSEIRRIIEENSNDMSPMLF